MSAPRPHRGDWLVKPRTIRGLWIVFASILGLTVLANLLFDAHGHFGVNDTFGFNAWYGLATCVAMVFIAKALGIVLKRRDSYYSHRGQRTAEDGTNDKGGA